MERIYIAIFSILISLLVGLISYWLKTTHTEIKGLISRLTEFTNQLKGLIVGIQTQLEKGVEADIQEIKTDLKDLNARTNRNESQITALKAKSNA